MLKARSRRLKLTRSTISATKTPALNAIQNQMLVDTGAPFHAASLAAIAKQHRMFQFFLAISTVHRNLDDP
jgi:hypothetical protein